MNALLIGGANPRNKQWIQEVRRLFAPQMFGTVLVHNHRHWEAGGDVDSTYELTTIAKEVATLGGEYIIFAKSIGAVLTLKGMRAGVLKPLRCIFVGLPYLLLREDADFLPWLEANNVPILLGQNTNDPVGAFADVKEYLANVPPTFQLIELPGDTHDYTDFQTLQTLIARSLE